MDPQSSGYNPRPMIGYLAALDVPYFFEEQGKYTPYSKMAAILVFFCFHANWPLWPRLRLNILLNLTFESEAIRANLRE